MRVYNIGKWYIDLDHVMAIGEPYVYHSCTPRIRIPVTYMFSQETYIELDITPYKSSPDTVIDDHFRDEISRVKGTIWRNLLTAWEGKSK